MENFERALHDEVIAEGGTELARRIGVNRTRLLDCANPNREAHKMNLELFGQTLTHMSEESRRRVLAALLSEFGYGLVSKAAAVPETPMKALMELVTESADVTRAVHDAVTDGRITSQEKFTIRREISEVRSSLDALEEAVRVA